MIHPGCVYSRKFCLDHIQQLRSVETRWQHDVDIDLFNYSCFFRSQHLFLFIFYILKDLIYILFCFFMGDGGYSPKIMLRFLFSFFYGFRFFVMVLALYGDAGEIAIKMIRFIHSKKRTLFHINATMTKQYCEDEFFYFLLFFVLSTTVITGYGWNIRSQITQSYS